MKKKSHNQIRGIILIFSTIFIITGCSNPLITGLIEQVQEDVSTALAGPIPKIESFNFTADADGISTSFIPAAVFDRDLDSSSITTGSVFLKKMPSGTPVQVTVIYNAETKTIELIPENTLDKESTYQLTISKTVKSDTGAQLEKDIIRDFTTRYFHDTELGIDLSYFSNDLSLQADSPIYFKVLPVPMSYPANPDSFPILTDYKITSSGKIAIPSSVFPGSSSGMILFFHDVDNDLADTDDGPDGDSDSAFYYNSAETGNLILADDADLLIADDATGSWFIDDNGDVIPMTDSEPDTTPAYYNINPLYIARIGQGYTVDYVDGSPYSEDAFEPLDIAPNTGRALSQGVYETARNIHTFDDVDYLEITPASSDKYEIRIKETSFDITVSLYDSDSDMYSQSNTLAVGTGTAERVINDGGTFLTGGQTYYLRVEATSNGMGEYEIGYFYKPVGPDPEEDADDLYDTSPDINFGRNNEVTRTLETNDKDIFKLVIPNNDFDLIAEVQEDPTYFDYAADSRNLDFSLSLLNSSGNQLGSFMLDSSKMVIEASDSWNYPAGTYYIEVQNGSAPIGTDYPTGQYNLLVTYAYDQSDQADNPNTGTNEYDNYNEHGPASYGASPSVMLNGVDGGTKGIDRTIYSVNNGENPEDDVDWIRVSASSVSNEYIFKAEPVVGEDGVVVNFDIYRADPDNIYLPTGTAISSSQPWSDNSIRGAKYYIPYIESPTLEDLTLWVKVTRDSSYSNNPLSGAYRFYMLAGADDEDSYYVDSSETDATIDVYSGTTDSPGTLLYSGGIDEAPWISKLYQNGITDFSDRNQLVWENLAGNADIPMVYRSLYRKDYDSKGESDGVTDKSSDYDFFWFNIPAGVTPPINMVIYCRSNYAFPIKVSTWVIDQTQWDTLSADRVITEAELGGASSYTTTYNSYEPNTEKLEQELSVSTGDYVFLKMEVDDSRVGDTYTEADGITTHTYRDSGAYQIWILE